MSRVRPTAGVPRLWSLAVNLATADPQSVLRRVVHFPPGTDLPYGEYVELPGRGTTYAARIDGPPGARRCSSCTRWDARRTSPGSRPSALREHYNLVLMDMRWHGRGISDGRFFRLSDCADDWVALADVLGIESFIPVGYSMGGVVAQLLWRRHPERVDGLVLCSTAANWHDTRRERAFFTLLPGHRADGAAPQGAGPARSPTPERTARCSR